MEQANAYSDRRRYDREACALLVDVDDYENAFCGKLNNLGLGGACIEALDNTHFQTGQELFLTIPYRHKADYLIIKGKIAWKRNKNFGVEFLKEPFAQ